MKAMIGICSLAASAFWGMAPGASRAEVPKDPLPQTILVVIPESFDKQVYDEYIGTEYEAFIHFVDRAIALRKHEQFYSVLAHMNPGGDRELGMAWRLFWKLLFAQPGSALSWGEHWYDSNYLTVESWKMSGKELCEDEAKSSRGSGTGT